MKKSASGRNKAGKPVQNVQRTPSQQRNVRSSSAVTKKTDKKKSGMSRIAANKPAAKSNSRPVERQASTAARKPIAQPTKRPSAAPKKPSGVGVARGGRRGSRGRNYSLYYFFAAVVLIIVFIILANTVLFDCTGIIVEGSTAYTEADIVAVSGISLGDNLLKADLDAAEQSIVTTFPYIDMAEVKQISPTKIKIVITEAEKWFGVRYGTRAYIISRRGKIVQQGSDNSLPLIVGYDANSPTVGGVLSSNVDGKSELPATILNAAEEAGITGITSVDMSDRFEIEMTIEDRITFQLGNSTELEGKMNIAKEFATNVIGATESVTIDLRNPEKVPVRDNNIIENTNVVPIAPEKETTESTSESTAQATSEG